MHLVVFASNTLLIRNKLLLIILDHHEHWLLALVFAASTV